MDVNKISDTMKIFADRLSDLLSEAKEQGDDLRSLSKKIGISKSTLSDYANTNREPRITELSKIADYFDVSSDWLLGLTNDRSRIPSAVDELGLSEKAISLLKYRMESRSGCILNELIDFICANQLSMLDAQAHLDKALKAKKLEEMSDIHSTPTLSIDESNNYCVVAPGIMADFLFDRAKRDIKYIISVFFDAISGRVEYQNFPEDFYDREEMLAKDIFGESNSDGNNKKN